MTAIEAALRQIYTAARGYEQQPEEPAVEFLQNIQRLCDAALRGLPLPPIYVVTPDIPRMKPDSGRDAVFRMRDEFLQYVSVANQVHDFKGAAHAQQMAIALHAFEDDNIITDMAWPAQISEDKTDFLAADRD